MSKTNSIDKRFYFKNFTIDHGHNSLPITTEALVFGAFLAQNINDEICILEIGTGSGILPLMIAQKCKVFIDSVEIDENAFKLACENVKNSTYSDKIGLFHTDIKSFEAIEKYDLIFTNPPFFQNHLKGKSKVQNLSKHNDSLSFEVLSAQVKRLLAKNGSFWVLLPPFELTKLTIELEKNGLFKSKELQIHHNQNKKVLRIIATFTYNIKIEHDFHFYIKDENELYTSQFTELLKDYYLNF